MELPVETYLGRSNLEVSTPRLSMLRPFLIKSFEFFLLCCFIWIVMFYDLKSSHGKNISWLHFSPLPFWNSASFMLLLQHFLLKTVKVCQNKANKWKNSVSSRQPTVPRWAFFSVFFAALSEWRPPALSCSVYANSKGRTGPSDSVAWVDVTRTWPWQQWKPGWARVTRRLHPSSVWNILR